jgi:hypothetical protein
MSSATNKQTHTRPFMGTKLQPRQGVSAGLFAGLGMLLLWLAGAQLWGPGAISLLTSIGTVIIPGGSQAIALMAGLIVHFAIAIGLGTLFAVSLDRLDVKDTLIVSSFYGFTIWVVSIVILRHWVQIEAVQASRSWWGLFVFLFFGFLLGVYANLFGLPPMEE